MMIDPNQAPSTPLQSRRLGVVLLMAVVSACPTADDVVVSGKVVDGANQPLEGVTISVDPPSRTVARTAANGTYSLLLDPDTAYAVTAQKDGYQIGTSNLPLLAPGEAAVRDFTLRGDTCEPGEVKCLDETKKVGTCGQTGTGYDEMACPENQRCVETGSLVQCRLVDVSTAVCAERLAGRELVFEDGVSQASFDLSNCGSVDLASLEVKEFVQSGDDYIKTIMPDDITSLSLNEKVTVDVEIDRLRIQDKNSATIRGVSIRVIKGDLTLLEIPVVVVRDLECAGKCDGAQNGIGGTCEANDCQGCCIGVQCLAPSAQDNEDCGGPMSEPGDKCQACAANFECSSTTGQCECNLPLERTRPEPDANCESMDPLTDCITTVTDPCGGATRTECVSCACNATSCPDGCCDAMQNCVNAVTNTQCPSMGGGSLCEACTAMPNGLCVDPPPPRGPGLQCCYPICDGVCEGAADTCGGTCSTVTNAPTSCAPRVEGGGFQTMGGGGSGNIRVESPSFIQAGNGCSGSGPMQVCVKHGRLE